MEAGMSVMTHVFLASCKTSSCQQLLAWTYICVNHPFQNVLWLPPWSQWISQPILRTHLLLIPSHSAESDPTTVQLFLPLTVSSR